jgi:hypothetical protein
MFCCHLAGQRAFRKRVAVPVRGISQLAVFLLLSSLCERTRSFSPLSTSHSQSQVLVPGRYTYARTFSIVSGSSRDELERMTIPELKEQLRSLGMKVGGRKSELVGRILSVDDVAVAIPSLSIMNMRTNGGEGMELAAVYDRVPDDAVVILACKS